GVADPMRGEHRLQLLARKVRMPPRRRETPDVGDELDLVGLQQLDEFAGTPRGVSDGPYGQNSRFFISLKKCERSTSASSSAGGGSVLSNFRPSRALASLAALAAFFLINFCNCFSSIVPGWVSVKGAREPMWPPFIIYAGAGAGLREWAIVLRAPETHRLRALVVVTTTMPSRASSPYRTTALSPFSTSMNAMSSGRNALPGEFHGRSSPSTIKSGISCIPQWPSVSHPCTYVRSGCGCGARARSTEHATEDTRHNNNRRDRTFVAPVTAQMQLR